MQRPLPIHADGGAVKLVIELDRDNVAVLTAAADDQRLRQFSGVQRVVPADRRNHQRRRRGGNRQRTVLAAAVASRVGDGDHHLITGAAGQTGKRSRRYGQPPVSVRINRAGVGDAIQRHADAVTFTACAAEAETSSLLRDVQHAIASGRINAEVGCGGIHGDRQWRGGNVATDAGNGHVEIVTAISQLLQIGSGYGGGPATIRGNRGAVGLTIQHKADAAARGDGAADGQIAGCFSRIDNAIGGNRVNGQCRYPGIHRYRFIDAGAVTGDIAHRHGNGIAALRQCL